MQRILQEFLIRLPFRSLTVVDYCNVVLFYSLFFQVFDVDGMLIDVPNLNVLHLLDQFTI